MSEKTKGCETCKYLARADNGYSNYTVMDTTVWCLRKLNPALPLNDADIESKQFDAALAFGETCAAKVDGDGPYFDVDGDVTIEAYKDDAEIYALLLADDQDVRS